MMIVVMMENICKFGNIVLDSWSHYHYNDSLQLIASSHLYMTQN